MSEQSLVRPADPVSTPLPDLLAQLGAHVLGDPTGIRITGLTLSSQRVRPGDLYAAMPGSRAHGAAFAADAVAAGAVAVLTDAAGAEDARDAGVPGLRGGGRGDALGAP